MSLAERSLENTANTTARVLIGIAVGLGILLLALALYGRIMGYDLRRDEFMFVPPMALLGQYDLYGDLFYNHVPYSAWLLRGVHLLLPWMDLLATARLTIFLAWLGLLGGCFWLCLRISERLSVAIFGVASLLSAEVLLGQTGMAATNNLLPLPFAMMGLGLFVLCVAENRPAFRPLFIAGLMLSIAAGMKASAIAFVPPVAIAAFLLPRDMTLTERARYMALPVALGGLIGALPLIWLAVTQTDVFFAHILHYHSGPHVAYWQANAASEPGLALSLGGKALLAQSIWLTGATLLAGFALVLAMAAFARTESRGRHVWDSALHGVIVVLAAMISAAVLGFVPTPGFPQYYTAPLIGIPLLAALLYRGLNHDAAEFVARIFRIAAALMLLLALPRLAIGLNDLRHPQDLTPARLERGAEALAAAMAEAGTPEGPVATLSPLYPLEAGLPIYPEFAAGPFAYRVAPYTDPDLRQLYVMAGPADLDTLFAATPPAAILTGFDAPTEAALVAYARTAGYHPQPVQAISDRYGSGTLWLRPANDPSAPPPPNN